MDNIFSELYQYKLSVNETLYQRIKKIMEVKNISEEEFYTRTTLNRNIMYDIKQNKSRPQLRTVITICIGLNSEPDESLELIKIAGYTMSNTLLVDCAYMELICHYNETDIFQCNEMLKEMGIEEKYHLGSRERIKG